MVDDRYTTTTVVETTEYITSQPTYSTPAFHISFDTGYLRTLGGIVKVIAIALCFLCFIALLIGGPGYYSGAGWATFVSTIGFSITLTLLFCYLFRVVDALPQVPWIVGEMVYCFTWSIFFFIAACVLAVAAARYSATAGWAVAAICCIIGVETLLLQFFAFGAMCTYAFDCYLKFLAWRNHEVATGGGPDYGSSASASPQKRAVINA